MSLDINYIPLSFISSSEEIIKQIKNTVLFGDLLNKNEETTLNHYIESTQYGYTASAQSEGIQRFVRITDIKNGAVDWDNVPFCNCDREDKYLLKPNDILIARTGGTTGKSFFVKTVPSKAVFASYLIRLRLKKGVDVDFIKSFLNSYLFWSQIVEMKSGSAMPNVNAQKLKTLRLPKCSIEVQQEISKASQGQSVHKGYVDLFQKVDKIAGYYRDNRDLSSELTHQLDLVKQLRQAFLREAMQGKLVPQNPNDEPASELFAKIKAEKELLIKEKKIKKQKPLPPIAEEEIPFEIPESWEWCRLGDVCKKIGSGSTPKGSNYSEKGIPFFRSQNIQNFGLVYDDIKFISEHVQEKMSGTAVFANDVLLNITGGSLGRCALVPDSFDEGNVSQHVCIIRPIYLHISFLHNLMLSPLVQQFIFNSTTGAGREGLPKYNLEQFVIPLPPLLEQQRIVAKLDELMQYCNQLEESIKNSQAQNELLLQQVLREALEN